MQGEHPRPVIDFLVRLELGELFGLHCHVGPEEVEVLRLWVRRYFELQVLGNVPQQLVLGLRNVKHQLIARNLFLRLRFLLHE